MKLQLFWKWPSGLVAVVLLVTAASRQEAFSQPTNTPPGLGPETVGRILRVRRERKVRSLNDLGLKGKRAKKIESYVIFE